MAKSDWGWVALIGAIVFIVVMVNSYPKLAVQAPSQWWKEVEFTIQGPTFIGDNYYSQNVSLSFNIVNTAMKTYNLLCSNELWTGVQAAGIDCNIETTSGSMPCDGGKIKFSGGKNLCPGESQLSQFNIHLSPQKLNKTGLRGHQELQGYLNESINSFILSKHGSGFKPKRKSTKG